MSLRIKGHRSRAVPAQGGFTLVEALVAAVILVIGIAGALAAISAGLQAQTVADYYQTTGWLLQEKLAELEAAPQLTAGRQSGAFAGSPEYTWVTEITEGPEGLWLVKVQVEESRGKNSARQSEITSYLLRR